MFSCPGTWYSCDNPNTQTCKGLDYETCDKDGQGIMGRCDDSFGGICLQISKQQTACTIGNTPCDPAMAGTSCVTWPNNPNLTAVVKCMQLGATAADSYPLLVEQCIPNGQCIVTGTNSAECKFN